VVYGNNTNVGTATADAAYTGDANHEGSAATQKNICIDKASSTTPIIVQPNVTYDGSALATVLRDGHRCRQPECSGDRVYGNNTNVGTADG